MTKKRRASNVSNQFPIDTLLLLGLGGAAIYLLMQKEKPEPTAVETVNVLSTPTGASVTIDSKVVGVTPLTYKISAGIHTITVSKSGYNVISEAFTVVKGVISNLAYTLVAAPIDPPNTITNFATGTVTVSKISIKLGENVTITMPITNLGNITRNVSVSVEVREAGNRFGAGPLSGPILKSSEVALGAGSTVNLTVLYTGIGTPNTERSIEITLMMGQTIAPNTSPSNPYHRYNLFSVSQLISFTYRDISVTTPIAGGFVNVGGDILLNVMVFNAGDSVFNLQPDFEILGNLGQVENIIKFVGGPIQLVPGHGFGFSVSWIASNNPGRKAVRIVLKDDKGTVLDSKMYGSVFDPVFEIIDPAYLTLNIVGIGSIGVTSMGSSLNQSISGAGRYVMRKGDNATLTVTGGTLIKFIGDTGVGWDGTDDAYAVYPNPSLTMKMDKNRSITAYFGALPSLTVRVRIFTRYWPEGVSYWRLEHYDKDGNMDLGTKFIPLNDYFAETMASEGNFGVVYSRTSDGSWMPTVYSVPIVLDVNLDYVIWGDGTIRGSIG